MSTYKKITKKQEKAHEKLLEKNIKIVGKMWEDFEKKTADLGFRMRPVILPARQIPIPGMYMTQINAHGMGIDEYDRHKNPEKWKKIDEERAEKAKKEAEQSAKKLEKDSKK